MQNGQRWTPRTHASGFPTTDEQPILIVPHSALQSYGALSFQTVDEDDLSDLPEDDDDA